MRPQMICPKNSTRGETKRVQIWQFRQFQNHTLKHHRTTTKRQITQPKERINILGCLHHHFITLCYNPRTKWHPVCCTLYLYMYIVYMDCTYLYLSRMGTVDQCWLLTNCNPMFAHISHQQDRKHRKSMHCALRKMPGEPNDADLVLDPAKSSGYLLLLRVLQRMHPGC